jgi:tetratricopeptide (TPR) repeat protein
LLLGLSICLAAVSAPIPDAKEPATKGPSTDEIKKAIDDLGSKRFAVRDKAKKFLQEAGRAAEPFLEEAAKSPDEEIASTAKAILEKYQWGLYPDTPKDVRDKIEQFRTGDVTQREAAIVWLMKRKPIPFATLRRLLAKEENVETRKHLFDTLYANTREGIPDLLQRGELDAAEELFELTLVGSTAQSAHDYATFMYLRGRLDVSIGRFENQRQDKGEAGERAAEVLVYLYRIKGDWAAARKAAEDSRKEELVELVLWQSNDWKALAKQNRSPDFGNVEGLTAAYPRLAGDAKAFAAKIDEIKKSADDVMDDAAVLRLYADALMLNGKPNDAIKILVDKKRELALTFDLLCAQMKHKEAFDLVNEARRRDTEPMERDRIEIRRARMLYVLGEKDSAIQLFQKLIGNVKGHAELMLARDLVKTEARVGLRDLAADHAGEAITQMMKAGMPGGFATLLEPVFGDNKEVAEAWWQLFRRELPDEAPAIAMKRVRDILSGKLDAKKLDEWIGKMAKERPVDPDLDRRPRPGVRSRFSGPDAVAAAYRATGDAAKTEQYLKQAAEKRPTGDRWIALGDFRMAKKKYTEAAAAYAEAAKHSHATLEVELDGEEFIMPEEKGPALATYLQGRALLLAGNTAEGKRLIELGHWLPLGNEGMRAKLVDELNKRDWPEMARKEAEMLMKTGWYQHFSYGNVMSYLAKLYAKEKDFFKAAHYYEKCIVGCLRTGASFVEPSAYLIVPESVRVFRARGLLAKGKIDEALNEALADLEVMPGNIDLVIKLVPEMEKLGKKKEADAIYTKVRDAYEKLAKEYPSSAFAHNSAAWIMANCRRELDEALKHAQKANSLEPKNAGYMDTLAEVNFRKGDRDKALALMKQCTEIDPRNAYFRKQLERFKNDPFDSPTPDEEADDDE